MRTASKFEKEEARDGQRINQRPFKRLKVLQMRIVVELKLYIAISDVNRMDLVASDSNRTFDC